MTRVPRSSRTRFGAGLKRRSWPVAVLVATACLLGPLVQGVVPAGASSRPVVTHGRVATFTFVHGRLATATDASGDITTYHYDSHGNLLWIGRSTRDSRKGGGDATSPSPPRVLSAHPTRVPTGGLITITGSDFSGNRAADIVRIGSLMAIVDSATPTRLTVTAPPGNGGTLSVQTPVGATTWNRVAITGAPVESSLPGGTDRSPMHAPPGVTALAGLVETAQGVPLAGVTLTIANSRSQVGATTSTDAKGQFLLAGLSAGHQNLTIDASRLSDGRDYGVYGEPVELPKGRTTVLPWITYLTPIDTSTSVTIPSPTVSEVTLTTPHIPGLEVRIPPGTVIRDRAGQRVRSLSITPLPDERTPFPWAPSMVPQYFTIQPGDATISGSGLQVIYPNTTGQPPGAIVSYLAESPSWAGTGWWRYGTGHVSANARQIIPDRGTRYTATDPGGYATDGAPGKGPKPGSSCECGDPVDLATGLLVETATDLSLPDVAGVSFTRTYRQLDDTVRDFGIGGSDSLDLYLNLTASGDFDLALPDGGTIAYDPTASTGVYDSTDTGTEYDGSVLTMGSSDPDGPFTLALKNGSTMTFGNPAYLTSVTDRFGNTLTINRHEYEQSTSGGGQIESVVTSSGRWLQFTYGACVTGASTQCVTQIEDNSGRTVSYTYDQYGRLLTVTNPDGGVTTNTWYPCTSSVTCTELESTEDPLGRTTSFQYDPTSGEVIQETQPNGGTWTYQYSFDASGNPSQTVVTDPDGEETSVAFDTSGYPSSTTIGYGTLLVETSSDTYVAGSGLLASTTDSLGRETTYTYDSLENILTETKLAGTPQAVTTTYTYEPLFSRLASITDPLGNKTTITYNDSAGTVTTTDPLGHSTVSTLNSEGLVVATTNALGHTTYYSYINGDLVAIADPLGNVLSSYYDAVGRPLEVTDAEGRTTTYTYDGLGDTLSSEDPLGNVTTWKYDPDREVIALTDPSGNTTTYTYSTEGDQLTAKNPLGFVTSSTYDLDGNLLTTTDPDGSVTTDAYNALGELISSTVSFHKYAAKTLYAYDLAGRQFCEVAPLEAATGVTCPQSPPSITAATAGATTTYYNTADQVVQVTDPTGATTQDAYDLDGNRYCTVAPLAYSQGVRCPSTPPTITSGSDPVIGASLYSFDALGQMIDGLNPLGGLMTYQFDAAGNLTSEKVTSNNSSSAPPATMTYVYDADNRVVSSTVAAGTSAASTMVHAYDPDGNVYCTVDPNAYAAGETCPSWQASWATTPPNPGTLYTSSSLHMVATSFRNSDGEVIQSSNPEGATTITAYNADGDAYCEVPPASANPWLAEPSKAGASYPYMCPKAPPTSAPKAGSTPGYQSVLYDNVDQPISVTNAVGDTTTGSYDPDGNVLTVTSPDGGVTTDCYYWQTTTCAKDATPSGGDASAIYSTTEPASPADPTGILTTYTYTAGGDVAKKTSPSGADTFGYDADGRIAAQSYSPAPSTYTHVAPVSYTYWPDGSTKTMVDGTGTTHYTYDDEGDPLTVSFVPATGSKVLAYSLSYTWYSNGERQSLTYPTLGSLTAGTVKYSYNSRGLLASVTDWNGNTTTFGYDQDGNNTRTSLPNGVTETASFDLGDTPTGLSTTSASSPSSDLTISYATTDTDEVGGETDTGAITRANTYEYDLSNRLDAVDSAADSYNADGDPTKLGSTAQSFSTADQLTSSRTGTASTTFSYDTLGDRISDTPASGSATTYKYDQAGQLSSITQGSLASYSYTYNGDGLRSSATDSAGKTQSFVYDDSAVSTPLLLSDGDYDFIYGPNGNLVEQVESGTSTYAITDYENTPRILTSVTGALVGTLTYSTTGVLTASTGSVSTPIGYTGGYTSDGGALVYLVNRYYDPATDQFLSIDPLVALTGSPYGYAGDNPVNATDPFGLSFLGDISCAFDQVANAVGKLAADAGDVIAAVAVVAVVVIVVLAVVVVVTVATGGLGDVALAALGEAAVDDGLAAVGEAAADAAGEAAAEAAGEAATEAAADAAADATAEAAADTAGEAAAETAGDTAAETATQTAAESAGDTASDAAAEAAEESAGEAEASEEASEAAEQAADASQEGAEAPEEGAETPGEGAEPPGEGAEPPGEGAEPPGEGAGPPGEGAEPPGEGAEPPEPPSAKPSFGTKCVAGIITGLAGAVPGAVQSAQSGNWGGVALNPGVGAVSGCLGGAGWEASVGAGAVGGAITAGEANNWNAGAILEGALEGGVSGGLGFAAGVPFSDAQSVGALGVGSAVGAGSGVAFEVGAYYFPKVFGWTWTP